MYAMRCFKLPKVLLFKIASICARFWWGSTEGKHKIHWKKWNSLCFPKEYGGLNFRDFEGFNKALIAKQVWRIFTNPTSMLALVLKSRYFPNSYLLQASATAKSSFFWKGFVWGLELLKSGLRKQIGNGRDTYIFSDPWLPRPRLFKVISNGGGDPNCAVSEFMTHPDRWDINKLQMFLCPEDVNLIASILISSSAPDKWIWHFLKSGKYSVRSGYKDYIMQQIEASTSGSGLEQSWWKFMWSLKIPSKVQQFIWRTYNNCIPTMANLQHRHIVTNGSCPVCGKGPETTDHALFRCSRAKKFWRLVNSNIHIREIRFDSIQDRFLDIYNSDQRAMLDWICVGA